MTPPRRHVLERGALRVTVACATDELAARFGPRFDRTAYVAELDCNRRPFLARAGLCDEFGLHGHGALGFAAAGSGDKFIKIGVGRLVRDSPDGYSFARRYPLAEAFPVDVEYTATTVTVRQASPAGPHAYEYRKQYLVIADDTLTIRYHLTNTGETAYPFEHYNHHWFAFNAAEIGAAYVLTPAFRVPGEPPAGWARTGGGLHPARPVRTRDGIGWRWNPPEGPGLVRLEHAGAQQAVEIHTGFPPSHFAVWANDEALCPELFHTATLPPGAVAEWSVTYRFSTGITSRQPPMQA